MLQQALWMRREVCVQIDGAVVIWEQNSENAERVGEARNACVVGMKDRLSCPGYLLSQNMLQFF